MHSLQVPANKLEQHRFLDAKLQQLFAHNGPISFETWMEVVLYTPNFGYYSSSNRIFGSEGDFVTAPNLSPMFGAALSQQLHEVLQATSTLNILEFGAGNGDLAHSILSTFREQNIHVQYTILELSADLVQRQKYKLQDFQACTHWIHSMPESFSGCMIANEVLDAMPALLVENTTSGWKERKIIYQQGDWKFALTPLNEPYLALLPLSETLPVGYQTEITPIALHWIETLAHSLHHGAILLLDYGFPQSEFFHPQRAEGTLMCHFQHKSHGDPFFCLGGQDITTHVNFSSIADTAYAQGLDILGYTTQNNFLLNCNILNILEQLLIKAPESKMQQLSQLNYLLSEAEMGELFKVMLLGKSFDIPPMGFSRGDRTHTL